jgi:hypothetical protein
MEYDAIEAQQDVSHNHDFNGIRAVYPGILIFAPLPRNDAADAKSVPVGGDA